MGLPGSHFGTPYLLTLEPLSAKQWFHSLRFLRWTMLSREHRSIARA